MYVQVLIVAEASRKPPMIKAASKLSINARQYHTIFYALNVPKRIAGIIEGSTINPVICVQSDLVVGEWTSTQTIWLEGSV